MIKRHIYDVYRKMNQQIDEKKSTTTGNGTEELPNKLSRAPRFIFRFALWAINVMIISAGCQSLLEISPFHGSMISHRHGFSGIKPIYLTYTLRQSPCFIAFGASAKNLSSPQGEMVERKYLDMKATLDERTVTATLRTVLKI